MKSIQLDCKMIKSLTIASDESKCDMTLKDILARRDEVFKDEIGCVSGIKAKLHLKQDAVPKFVKARSVAFALRPKAEQFQPQPLQDCRDMHYFYPVLTMT